MRWFYYYPTFNKPSGGNKQLRLMASLLPGLGVEAFLLRDRKFFADGPGAFDDNTFYGVDVPVADFPFEEGGSHLRPDDVLLLPEVCLERSLSVCRDWMCRLAVNNQNGFYGLRYGPPAPTCRRSFEFVIANAPYVASLCKDFLGIAPQRIFHVPHWVVRPPFEIEERQSTREAAVCYMPRKLPDVVSAVRQKVQQTHPDVRWVEIDGVPEPEVARRYRQNSIFFAAQDLEGCPLTALEAMTCGCLIAGFPGTARFVHPYATPANGLWAADRDVDQAAAAVGKAIDIVRAGGEKYKSYLAAGRETVRRFTKQAVLSALAELVEHVRDRNYLARTNMVAGLGWRGQLCAYRLLYDYDRLGWMGKAVSTLARATKPVRTNLARLRG
jgi:hypothetical protein